MLSMRPPIPRNNSVLGRLVFASGPPRLNPIMQCFARIALPMPCQRWRLRRQRSYFSSSTAYPTTSLLVSMPRPTKIVLDTSAATLQRSSGESSSQGNQNAPQPQTATSPRSRWSPPTSTPSADSPLTRIRRSISVVASPVAAAFHRRSILRRSITSQHQHRDREQLAQTAQSFMMTETNIATPLLATRPKTPLEKFRDAGHQVITMNRLKRAILVEDMEPTRRRPSVLPVVAAASGPCTIDVVDYGIAHHRSARLGNHDLATFLEEQKHKMTSKHVRWIDITGASWEVASTLAELYGGKVQTRTRPLPMLTLVPRASSSCC